MFALVHMQSWSSRDSLFISCQLIGVLFALISSCLDWVYSRCKLLFSLITTNNVETMLRATYINCDSIACTHVHFFSCSSKQTELGLSRLALQYSQWILHLDSTTRWMFTLTISIRIKRMEIKKKIAYPRHKKIVRVD